jgi:hypothetical protein
MPKLSLRIVGRNLPGRQFESYDNVHIGIQRRADVIDMVPGDAAAAVFDLDVDVVAAADGYDFRGPYVHGKRGERFLYLSWGAVSDQGSFEMFRRAKLHLSILDVGDIERALRTGAPIEGRLDLSDEKGGPRCASVRPPLIQWNVLEGVQA